MKGLKLYDVNFEGVYPVGNCLVIAAKDIYQAKEIASKTIAHTDTFIVNEIEVKEPKVIVYLSGDY